MMKNNSIFGTWLQFCLTSFAALVLFWSADALAAPECEFGYGEPCNNSDECTENEVASVCASSSGDDASCQVPCVDASGHPDEGLCSMGETCVPGVEPGLGGGDTYFCKASKFAMDLNLLDACVYHFLEGLAPDLSSNNQCSLIDNLNQMLDQDANRVFNIFDVDLCVKSFLGEEPCDRENTSCPDDQVYCEVGEDDDSICSDDSECPSSYCLDSGRCAIDDCGSGLHCDPNLNKCVRECGYIVSREGQSVTDSIDRTCAGTMKACDYDTGRCNGVTDSVSCQIDQDCPSGAYCYLGQCAPRCYRSIDCPGSQWFCSETNTCQPKPKVGSTEAFNPKDYSIQFAGKEITLDPVQESYDLPLLIMNLITRKQVFDSPNAVFGYRLELEYERKQSQECEGELGDDPDLLDECIISADEEFLTLASPFGTLYAVGDPTLGISANPLQYNELTPGIYLAKLTAIFSNGNRTSVRIKFKKPSPSGDYLGALAVYTDANQSPLARTGLSMRLYVDKAAKQLEWDELLANNNIDTERAFEDITRGYLVKGYLHGGTSAVFNQPKAINSDDENEIPITGILSPEAGIMHLIAVVDYGTSFCRSENGRCGDPKTEAQIRNAFGRKIRRTIEFIGNFDDRLNRFAGTFREKFSGLVPFDVTLDGDFSVTQTVQDDTPVVIGPLQASRSSVGFLSSSQLYDEVDQEVDQYCDPESVAYFTSEDKFRTYLDGFDVAISPVNQDSTRFDELLEGALAAVEDTEQGATASLTLGEFLAGHITPCETDRDTDCYDVDKIRCGLALYRKAVVRGWVKMSSIGGVASEDPSCSDSSECQMGEYCVAGRCRASCTESDGTAGSCSGGFNCVDNYNEETEEVYYACVPQGLNAALFCGGDGVPGRDGDTCPLKAQQEPTIAALQEHNRFYKQARQAFAFGAGRAQREAFFAMFRAAKGDPLDESTAYAYKGARLREALDEYENIRKLVFDPVSADIHFRWPMNHFQTRGLSWINELHAMVSDRMTTLLEYVDHRRRVLKSGSQRDHLFAQHVMHQEYLQQVYLMALQKHWEGSSFAYAGRAEDLLAVGEQLLARSKDSRNPLGLHPNRIYFENSDLNAQNWQNFRARLAGELDHLKTDVSEAVSSMQQSLRDLSTFEESLLREQQSLEAEIEGWCGDETPLPQECNLSREDVQVESACLGQDCLYQYQCDGQNCESVIQTFEHATSNVQCSLGQINYTIDNYKGGSRPCFRGRIGALEQEKASLELQRKQIVSNVQSLVRRIARQEQYIADSQTKNEALLDFISKSHDEMGLVADGVALANHLYEVGSLGASMLECIVIAGVAGGTDCPQKAVAASVKIAGAATREAMLKILRDTQKRLTKSKELTLTEDSQDRQLMGMRMELDNMVTEVENHIASYEAVAQQLFNVNIQVQDGVFQAQQLANRHTERLVQQIEHLGERLSGGASGDVLTTNAKVAAANVRFRRMLLEAYKMTRAFVHRFNLSAESENWSNRVYEIVTVQDMENFIGFLDDVQKNYCGAEGLDCDYINNGEVFEFSVQKQLFPNLRDIVDPATGNVMTVGEQFHNLITSSGFVKRRARPYGLAEQIELPFAVWLNDRGDSGSAPQRYLVGPGDCNHIIRGETADGGTVAVNVIGTRIPKSPGVKFELWRGNTDYIRSCTERKTDTESKINTYIVGWTPSSTLGQLDNPPSFITQSGELSSCINNHLLADPSTVDSQDGCFRYFARDRSLGAPDYTLVIPQLDRDQEWLLGDGLPANERPIIEDIVMYFRYNDRPITSAN